MGLIHNPTGSFSVGMVVLACGTLVSAAFVFILGHDRRLEHVPAELAGHAD